jgi:hypothetical protein
MPVALADDDEAVITVRGQERYVVMTAEHYQLLREYELIAAVAEAHADIAADQVRECSISEHLAEVTDAV